MEEKVLWRVEVRDGTYVLLAKTEFLAKDRYEAVKWAMEWTERWRRSRREPLDPIVANLWVGVPHVTSDYPVCSWYVYVPKYLRDHRPIRLTEKSE